MDAIGGERRCRSVASLYRGAAHGRFGLVSLLLCLSFATCCMANSQKVYNYAKGGNENWNWTPTRHLYQAIYGTNIAAMTLMLVGYNRTDPSHHFVAIRQHNLAVDKRYMLKAELNCLLNYSKGPDTIAPESGVHTKWYRNGQRIRKDRLETYLFSLTGEDRSILLLTDFQDNMNHTEELNGEYVCAVYNRKGLLIVKKTFDVKIFYPPELNGFDRRPLIEEMAKKVSVPKTGVISVLAKGLSWVTLGWQLQVVHLKYNVANVTKIIIRLTGAASNPTPTEIDNPAEEGQVNITGLDQDQLYKIRSKTYNGPNHSSTGRREEFRTDLLPSVECESTTLTVVAGSNQTVECLIRGRPQPDMEMQRFDVDSLKTLQNKKIVILSWSNMHYGIVRRFTCFDVWNKYDRIRTCIQKIIYCRPLPVPKNGFAKVLDGLTPNGKTIFSCKEGFFLNGTYERQCVDTTSKWDQHQPTCLAHTSPTAEIEGGPYLFMSAGKQVQFNCKVTGIPPPRVQWYVNGDEIEIERRLPYQTKVFVDSQDLKKLHVRASVNLYMDYNVTCTAINELGSAKSQAMLIMAGTAEKVDVYEHEEISLTCLDLPDLQDVSWNDSFQVTTGNASIVLGPPAVRYNQSVIVCYNREVDNLKAYVINVLPAEFVGE
ncbi:uncharacterized protein LOC135817090 isoform X1 [Sycon ciliatum]|uniref:uncharacterized protein LOC135817090 isoform X1 n=1 Tax=Sycon ciliatum TaxID=27933 RepID=UPI0031F600C7